MIVLEGKSDSSTCVEIKESENGVEEEKEG